MVTVCEEVGCPPGNIFREWCRVSGEPACGQVPNWPKYLTAGEWFGLAAFAERYVLARVRKHKTLTEV